MWNIYESEAFAQMPDGSMHPGGLRLTDRAVRLAGLDAGMHVADIGCGTGVTAAFLSGKHKLNVIGLELSGALIDIGLRNNPGLKLIRWDCETISLEDDSLDAIMFECSLSVIGNTKSILAQCAKALKKSGVIIISDVCVNQGDFKGGKKMPLTSATLMQQLAVSGFDVIVHEDHTAALRTYMAELKEKNGNEFDACALFGGSCNIEGIRPSDFGYMLMIARKI